MKTVFSVDSRNIPPQLLKNGVPVYPMLFWQSPIEERDGRAFSEAGIELYTFGKSYPAYEHPYYVAEDTYDFSWFDSQMELFRRACPGKYCIPRIFINAPYWWLEKHPEECCQFAASTDIYRHQEPGKPLAQGTYHESFASELWKRDMGNAFRMLIRHIKESDYAESVVGIHIANGHCGEWHYWGSSEIKPDISAPMKAYTKDADSTPEGRNWEFYDRFFEAEYDAISHFARIVKEETNGEYLTAVFYCYITGNGLENAHGAAEKLLKSPDIDIISAPHDYSTRFPGGSAYFRCFPASVAAHGKLFIDEADDRTCFSLEKYDPLTPGKLGGSTLEESVMVIRREFGYALTHNAGLWYMDHNGNGFHSDELMAEVANLHAWGVKAMKTPRPRCSEVALIYDMRGNYYLPKCYKEELLPYNFMSSGRFGNLCRAGAPFDVYLAGDVTLPEISKYKVIIFVNLLAPTPEVREAIEALKGNGRTLIWSYSSGLYDENNNPDGMNMKSLTGLDGFRVVESVEFPESGYQKACVQSPGVLPLAAEQNFKDWRSVYTWNPDLSIEMLRREYERAGVWNYLETPDTLTVSSGALMIHAKDGGVKTIRLPEKKVVTDITLNRELGECETFRLELKANETRIFLLDN